MGGVDRFRTLPSLVFGGTAATWGGVWRGLLRARRGPTEPDPGARLWARHIQGESDIPASFRDAFARLDLAGKQPLPYTVVTPASEGIHTHPENEKLILVSGDRVYVLENEAAGMSTVSYALGDIFCVEHGTILLYSWLGIHGRTLEGVPSSTVVRFNTVTEHIMSPITESLRQLPDAGEPPATGPQGRGLAPLDDVALKFRGYTRSSLPPGDAVMHSIFQPQIRRGLAGPMGLSLRWAIAPAQLVMLTRRELILIYDDDSQRPAKGEPYGAIRTYVPLPGIMSASIGTLRRGLIALRIHLSTGLQIELKFESSRQEAVEQLRQFLPAPKPTGPGGAAVS